MTMKMKHLPLLPNPPNKLLNRHRPQFHLTLKQLPPKKLLLITSMTSQPVTPMANLTELKQKTHNKLLKIKLQQSTTTSIQSETKLS